MQSSGSIAACRMAKRKSPDRQASCAETAAERQRALPTITHLQFLVLDCLAHASDGLSVQQLNAALSEFTGEYKGPKFYQLMGRLADAGLVESWAQDFDAGGTTVSRTFYRLASSGETAWRLTADFYRIRLAIRRKLADRDA